MFQLTLLHSSKTDVMIQYQERKTLDNERFFFKTLTLYSDAYKIANYYVYQMIDSSSKP